MASWKKYELYGARCHHCKLLLTPGVVKVDTGVFKGTNPDSYEEAAVWKCTGCGVATSETYQPQLCRSCRVPCIDQKKALNLPFLPISLRDLTIERPGTRCTSCIMCAHCQSNLEKDFLISYDVNTSPYIIVYVHQQCRIPFEKQLEQKTKAQEQERTARLTRLGHCLVCERPLSLLDKMRGRQKHSTC